MSTQKPYSWVESDSIAKAQDARHETQFTQLMARFDRIEAKFDAKFTVIDKDLFWLKWLTGGVVFLLINNMLNGFDN